MPDDEDEITMVIGPDRSGRMLEVGVAEWHDGMAIFHANRAQKKWLGGIR